ncbi:hypothetical protein IKZ40_03590, partial [bacterium]|nr:hypothetical protein [bacterium]
MASFLKKYKYLLLILITAVAIVIIALPGKGKGKVSEEPKTLVEQLEAIEVPELPEKKEELPKEKLATVWNISKVKRGDVVKGLGAIKGGVLIDASKGDVLWAKNEKDPLEIASMTKMMTTLLAVEADE